MKRSNFAEHGCPKTGNHRNVKVDIHHTNDDKNVSLQRSFLGKVTKYWGCSIKGLEKNGKASQCLEAK